MLVGQFCFIKDEYFQKFNGYGDLMQNKQSADGGPGGRPCFFVFDDSQVNSIKWCIPLSSQVAKYKDLRKHKISQMKEKGIKPPVCTEICFGRVRHRESAFLVHSMFPVTEKYIAGYWMDRAGNYVTVHPNTVNYIVRAANTQLERYNKGQKCFFVDVASIRSCLIQELKQEGKLRVEPGVVTSKVFIPKPTAYTLPTEAERYRPSPPREDTLANYAAQIVKETEKAIAARKTTQKNKGKHLGSKAQE